MILTVTREQWDVMAEGLGELPLKRSQPVLHECIRQINEQLQAHQMLAAQAAAKAAAAATPGTGE